jgi:replication initiation protein RepC
MQTLSDGTATYAALQYHAPHRPRGGGRKASQRYRQAIELSESFTGLPSGVSRFDLLLLAKRGGREVGFTPKMIQLLEYYMIVLTRDIDWEEGRPIVYQGLSKTALELGVSERQIQALEKSLFEIGAMGYVDSGNCRRFGYRDPASGKLEYAFGPDLSPLVHMHSQLEEAVRQKQEHNRQWHATKRQISAARRQIRSLLLEWRDQKGEVAEREVHFFETQYDQIAIQLRTHLDLAAMASLLERHQLLLESIGVAMGVCRAQPKCLSSLDVTHQPLEDPLAKGEKTDKPSSLSTNAFAHNQYTNQVISSGSRGDLGSQEGITTPPVPPRAASSDGAEHVTLSQALRVASDRFRAQLPLSPSRATWSDVVEAAYRARTELGISQASWGEACEVVGRTGAALCLLVTDRATLRHDNRVRYPAAYFRGMVARGRVGRLHLQRSVFGLLQHSPHPV